MFADRLKPLLICYPVSGRQVLAKFIAETYQTPANTSMCLIYLIVEQFFIKTTSFHEGLSIWNETRVATEIITVFGNLFVYKAIRVCLDKLATS